MIDTHAAHPIHAAIDRLLMTVASPGRYAGGEFNSVRQNPRETALRWGIVHPDLYETAFGVPELATFYHQLNQHPEVAAERCCCPDRDLEAVLNRHGLPLFTLETRTPLRELDVIQVHANDALTAVNIPAMLELGGMAGLTRDRGPDQPVVVLSGALAYTPEPLADLVDLVLVGELEDVIEAFVEQWRRTGFAGASRADRIGELARTLDGAYWPAAYVMDEETGSVSRRGEPAFVGLPDRIPAARVFDLERTPAPDRPVVAGVRTPHDRLYLEIQRGVPTPDPDPGCLATARHAVLPPSRTRSVSRVFGILESQYTATGHEVVVVRADRPGLHPDLAAIVAGVKSRLDPDGVHLVVPGLPIADQLELLDPGGPRGSRPSAGSQIHLAAQETSPALARHLGLRWDPDRLRQLSIQAYRHGFTGIVAGSVLGVPGERDEDVAAMGVLARQLSAARREVDGRCGRLEWTLSAWIPRPHSPGGHGVAVSGEELRRRLGLVRRALGRRKDVRMRAPDLELAPVESVLLRSDRRMGARLLALARDGVRFTRSPFHAQDAGRSVARLLSLADPECGSRGGSTAGQGDRTPWSHVEVRVES